MIGGDRQRGLDPLYLLARLPVPGLKRCAIPRDLERVTSIGPEAPGSSDVSAEAVERVWGRAEAMYRTGVYPALQLCIRRGGRVVLNRAIGHARGNAPADPPDAEKIAATAETPFNLFSASKAITAMVIHKLDQEGALNLEDRVSEFIPEFARYGKQRITIRHLLAHRAGIPNVPPEYLDLDLLSDPERILEILCETRIRTRPGRLLAYHAISGGFVLGEVVRAVTGQDIRTVLEQRILEPLGFRWLRYGVRPEDLPRVAQDAVTGPPVPPPLSWILRNALGTGLERVVELCNDPRFLTGVVPSANAISTASEAAAFYQCLLDEGVLDGVRVFHPRTVHRATSEQSFWELDLTLGIPIRYGLGFMLGNRRASLFGWDNRHAFGHVGFTNTFTWADPERQIAVALLTNGKPVVSLHAVRLVQFMAEINRAFPKHPPADASRRARRAA